MSSRYGKAKLPSNPWPFTLGRKEEQNTSDVRSEESKGEAKMDSGNV